MRFYTGQHRFYGGIDLHARSMHLCILDAAGQVVFDRDLGCRPEPEAAPQVEYDPCTTSALPHRGHCSPPAIVAPSQYPSALPRAALQGRPPGLVRGKRSRRRSIACGAPCCKASQVQSTVKKILT
jgi:hypothetical protein